MSATPEARAAALLCWKGPVAPEPLAGGISNRNFVVVDGGERFVVRIGGDVPVHGVLRVNEVAASRAAFAAGLAPEVVHAEPGALVLRHIENARAFTEADVRDPANLAAIVELVRRCHGELAHHLRGPVPMFWVFHVIRRDARTLVEAGSRIANHLPRYLEINRRLEVAVGPIHPVTAHNDLLAGNLIHDGARLWLIDWEHAGFNDALYDLGNLSVNNGFAPEHGERLLESYFQAPVDDALRRRFRAMKCASALREGLWSAVSEIHLGLDFDYAAYTGEHLGRFEQAYLAFLELGG